MSLEDKRRAGFEAHMDASTPAGWAWHERDETGYLSKSVQDKWEMWNAALDSVVIELPAGPDPCDKISTMVCCAIEECRIAIEAAGLKVVPGLKVAP